MEGRNVNNDMAKIKRMLQQLAVGRRGESFRMEGRNINNDMAEIKWMLQQLAVRMDRIEAQRRGERRYRLSSTY
ncbi:hypothetical protein ACLB2K_006685 [Fragaria x ananassa]